MNTADLLIEIGTAELPPKALLKLSTAFSDGVKSGLAGRNLSFAKTTSYATPRRLAVLIENLQVQADDRPVEALGPPADRARNEDGRWNKAAEGFARNNGVGCDELEIAETGKGPRLMYRSVARGVRAEGCLQDIINQTIRQLPIPKRMRWGAGRTEFVRPVHWIVVLLDETVVPCNILGRQSGRLTRGHRFHSRGDIEIARASQYAEIMQSAKVIARFEERRTQIRQQVEQQAAALGDAQAVLDDALLDEVTALVEWPVALTGNFEERFLQIPSEALIYSMKEHQKYFPVRDSNGALLPHFIAVSNIESRDPTQVIEGNERVIRPRLADADFFFNTDKKTALADRVDRLRSVVFQQKLGTLYDKTQRVVALTAALAGKTGADEALARRAALLSKTDLITEMVGEFADMQGIAGRYYALYDGEAADVGEALEQQYWPRFSGAPLPQNPVATALALADRLDTIVGIFGIGQPPTGSRDPFALRRASLGVLRIIVEGKLALDLRSCLEEAAANYPRQLLKAETTEKVLAYMIDRFGAWYEDAQIPTEVFQAVAAKDLSAPLDIDRRVKAVAAFSALPEAVALAAANKRVSNIIDGQAPEILQGGVSKDLLQNPAELALSAAVEAKGALVRPLFEAGKYTEVLASLADLQQPVDAFFTEVMVMADDEAVKTNRLRLLSHLRSLFLQVADISRLGTCRT